MEVFKTIAGFNEWIVIWPEISLGLLAVFLIVVDLFLPERYKGFVPLCAFIGQLLICAAICLQEKGHPNFNFNQLIYQSVWTEVMRVFFLTSSLLVTYLGYIYFKKHALIRSEFYALLLIATGALMLLVQANHFVMVFVALETFSIAGFVLTSYDRKSAFSLEAGLKFLIFGALSSAILLFGIVLLYGIAGNPLLENATADALNFTQLGKFIEVNAHSPLVRVGAVLVLIGLFFKMGIVPFQVWIPDVYQGAPTPITALLAVSSKAAGFLVVLNLIRNGVSSGEAGSYGPFFHLNYLLIPLISGLAVITILYGNVAALSQSNVKKLMGYSGIAHAGYLLIGVIASFYESAWAAIGVVIFYLFTYLLGSFGVFAVMGHMATPADEDQELEDYHLLSKGHPFLASVLTIGMGSLTGVPPFVGFIGKFFILGLAFSLKLYWLVAIAIVGVVISVYYYFGWMREALFPCLTTENIEAPACQAFKLHWWHYIVLGLLAFLTVFLGIAPMFLKTLLINTYY